MCVYIYVCVCVYMNKMCICLFCLSVPFFLSIYQSESCLSIYLGVGLYICIYTCVFQCHCKYFNCHTGPFV